MIKIKGPLVIKRGEIGNLVQDAIDKGEITVGLPFTATGWKSTKNFNLVEGGVELTEEVSIMYREDIIKTPTETVEPNVNVITKEVEETIVEDQPQSFISKIAKKAKGRPKKK